MQIPFADSNRIGCFRVMFEALKADRELHGALFAICVLLYSEPDESGRGMKYYAASEIFQPLLENEEIPEYRIEFASPGNKFADAARDREAVKAPHGWRFAAVRKIILRPPAAQFGHSTTH